MALSFAHGAIQWLAADAATTVYTVSGLSFQPKAIRFYWMGIHSAGTDATASTVHFRRGIGFATSTSNRRAVGSTDQDAANTSVCTTGYRDDCVAMTLARTPAADGLLDLNSITSDGFTVIVDDQAPVNVTVFWEAWGGDDITVATVIDIAEPAANGNVDYTVAGFTGSDTDDQVVMFAGVQATGTSPAAARGDSGLCVGFASGGASGENVVLTGNADDAIGTMDCDGYSQTGECLAMITVAGGTPSARATLTQFGTDNFRLSWTRGTTNRRYIALAIKGGSWRAGSILLDGGTLNATTTVSGLPFAPVGVCLMGKRDQADTAGVSVVDDRIALGSGSSTSSRRAMSGHSLDGSGSCEIYLGVEYDQVLLGLDGATGAAELKYDLNAMNADGFQIITDLAGGGADEWCGYLTFGDAPVTTRPPLPVMVNQAVMRSATW